MKQTSEEWQCRQEAARRMSSYELAGRLEDWADPGAVAVPRHDRDAQLLEAARRLRQQEDE